MKFTKQGPKRRRNTRRETSPVSRQGWVGGGPRTRDQRRTDRVALLAEASRA